MSKKIKHISIEGTIGKRVEALPLLMELKEFKNLTIMNHTREYHNAICIFSSEIMGTRRYYSREITLKTNPPYSDSNVFYDWVGVFPQKKKYARGILFKFPNGKIAGYFRTKTKTLVLCDITHDETFIPVAKEVLLEIFDHLRRLGHDPYKIFTNSPKELKLQSLGTDPEFALIDIDGETVLAEDFYDSLEAPIGRDGSGSQLELRPTPGDIDTVVRSLKHLLSKVAKSFDVGFDPHFSYGGHIHFGYGEPVTPTQDFLDVLDDFLGRRTRDLVERYDYGRLSDYETKPWGFEYRTPSGAIFSNPKIARISLKIAKLIGERLGQKIEYNYPVRLEDYVKLGLTNEEALYFLDFTKEKRQYSSILGFWKIKSKARARTFIKLYFSDEWHTEVKDQIRTAIREKFSTEEPREMIYITLYGLAEERGYVNTIPVKGYEVIEHSMANKTTIGVARSIRMGEDVDILIKALIDYINKEVL